MRQLDRGADHFTEEGNDRVRFQDAKFIKCLGTDLEGYTERIVRVVSRNDEEFIPSESPTISTLVWAVSTQFFGTINDEAIVEF